MILIAIALLVILIDQVAKFLVRHYLELNQSVPILREILHLTHVNNTGTAFGLLENRRPLFLVVTALVVVVIGIYYFVGRPHGRLVEGALGLELGGALGNLVDRVAFGRVTDFLDIRIWPIFNVADSAIVAGVGVLVLAMLMTYRAERSGEHVS